MSRVIWESVNIASMIGKCWSSMLDDGPALTQSSAKPCAVDWVILRNESMTPSRGALFESVDWCICFTRKIQHGGDWERSRPQGPKIVHNFLMTVRPLSWACRHGTEMLMILKKIFQPDYWAIFSNMTVQRNVPRFCTWLICGWNLF